MQKLALAVLAIALLRSSADACDCAEATLAEAAQRAKVVLVVTVTKEHQLRKCRAPRSCPTRVTYDATVDGIYKGTAGKATTLDAGAAGMCSLGSLGKTAVGTQFVVFSSSTQAPHALHLCGGTQRATAATLAELARLLGKPKQP